MQVVQTFLKNYLKNLFKKQQQKRVALLPVACCFYFLFFKSTNKKFKIYKTKSFFYF